MRVHLERVGDGEGARRRGDGVLGVIKDMRGDRDGLARTPAKVLMVAGHTAFPFSVHVCVCEIERHRGEAGQ